MIDVYNKCSDLLLYTYYFQTSTQPIHIFKPQLSLFSAHSYVYIRDNSNAYIMINHIQMGGAYFTGGGGGGASGEDPNFLGSKNVSVINLSRSSDIKPAKRYG